MAERRIYTGNGYAADEFEMLTLLFYQELNQECAEILADGLHPEHFYATAKYPLLQRGATRGDLWR